MSVNLVNVLTPAPPFVLSNEGPPPFVDPTLFVVPRRQRVLQSAEPPKFPYKFKRPLGPGGGPFRHG